METFDIVNGRVVLSPEAMALPHIEKLNKETNDQALMYKYIQYIVFTTKWNTPYKAYDESSRQNRIKGDIFGDDYYELPENVLECLRKHDEFSSTPSTRLLDAAEQGVEFIIAEYNDLKKKQGEVDKLGKPLVTAKQVGEWLAQLGPAVKNLAMLKELVMKEQLSSGGRIKGGSEKGYFEDPR